MSISAFGVDHGDSVSKKHKDKAWHKEKSDPTPARVALGATFGPQGVHGAIAGKGVKGKAKTIGTEWAGGMAGAAAGSKLPGAAKGPGSLAGFLGGGGGGAYVAHKRGWLKREDRAK